MVMLTPQTIYALITGYDNTSFCPADAITREQAMVILARALKLTGCNAGLTDNEAANLMVNYTDASAVSEYAKTSIATCLKTGCCYRLKCGHAIPKGLCNEG